MSKNFYITTTLPYVNAKPHIGFAMEIIRADAIARYKKTLGYDVFFNTGTDEHGAKIFEVASEKGLAPQEYVDTLVDEFRNIVPALGISEDINFIRTTDAKHVSAAQEMWKRCFDNGDIYKKQYKVKYCVGCELEKTDSELVNGRCVDHPNREIEVREEENYFFKFSNYQKPLLDFYNAHTDFVQPDFRFNEIKAFVSRGLEDFSISRLKSKMPWGVPVPGDDEHVMYVWFDALTNYISALDWPDGENYKKYWVQEGGDMREVVQYCGKDNLRQQSAMWQAMLMSAKLPNTTNIVINGFITSGGQKMSKSIGNVISPFDIIEMFKDATEYPEDVLRFVLLHDVSSFEDSDVTADAIKASYQANLANGIGNLTNRIMKMATSYGVVYTDYLGASELSEKQYDYPGVWSKSYDAFDLHHAIVDLFKTFNALDVYIQREEPFRKIKTNEAEAKKDVAYLLHHLLKSSYELEVFMPKTALKIRKYVRENKMPEKPLFNRLG